jgi:hypothetical protein
MWAMTCSCQHGAWLRLKPRVRRIIITFLTLVPISEYYAYIMRRCLGLHTTLINKPGHEVNPKKVRAGSSCAAHTTSSP